MEIGPGCGQISQYLDLSKKEYIGVEIDSSLSSFLVSKFPYLKIINKDFLEVTEEEILNLLTAKEKILLFGNIPYSISTKIFLKFLREELFEKAYFTVQKEFFEVISAPINTKKYSSLSVLFQTFCELKSLFLINRLNFFPKPKVDSIFLSIKKNSTPDTKVLENYSLFIKKCFSKPRKILSNNLISKDFSELQLQQLFIRNNLNKNIRAHQLTPQELFGIFSNLNS